MIYCEKNNNDQHNIMFVSLFNIMYMHDHYVCTLILSILVSLCIDYQLIHMHNCQISQFLFLNAPAN